MKRFAATLSAAALAISLSACTTTADRDTAVATAAVPSDTATERSGPALWKVADEDTTIYLFGTVHALPAGVEWYKGPVAAAITSAQTLVTEVDSKEMADPQIAARFQQRAALPAGETLRGNMTAEQRATYEGALTKMGMPVAAFDQVKPWFAAVTLGVLPLLKAGYAMENGVETAIEAKIGAGVERGALETVDDQIGAFDSLPMDVQTAYLIEVAEQIDEVVPMMNDMIARWARGDADGLAELLNEEIAHPTLATALLYNRNRNWADWIDERLGQPGTVFIAVGAGHLAGKNSVQDYLRRDGIVSTRVQ